MLTCFLKTLYTVEVCFFYIALSIDMFALFIGHFAEVKRAPEGQLDSFETKTLLGIKHPRDLSLNYDSENSESFAPFQPVTLILI